MKRLFIAATAVLLGMFATGCDGEGGSEPLSWDECVVSYSLLEYFPEYDGDIENAYYINDSEGETLMFCDYNVEREHVEAFKNKLGASGFIKKPSSGSTVYWYNNTGTYSLRIGIDDYETYVIIELTRLAHQTA